MLSFHFSSSLSVCRSEKQRVSEETSGYRRHEAAERFPDSYIIHEKVAKSLLAVQTEAGKCFTSAAPVLNRLSSSIPERTNNQQSGRDEGSALARLMLICCCREPRGDSSPSGFQTSAWKSEPFPRCDRLHSNHRLEISMKQELCWDNTKAKSSFAHVWRHCVKDKEGARLRLFLGVVLAVYSRCAWADAGAQSVSLQGACLSASAWASPVGVRELVGVAAVAF